MKDSAGTMTKQEAAKPAAVPKKKTKVQRALTLLMYMWPLVLIVIVALVIWISTLVGK